MEINVYLINFFGHIYNICSKFCLKQYNKRCISPTVFQIKNHNAHNGYQNLYVDTKINYLQKYDIYNKVSAYTQILIQVIAIIHSFPIDLNPHKCEVQQILGMFMSSDLEGDM